jgi:hypothetical protein
MQRLEVSGAVRPLKWPLGVKWLIVALLFNSNSFYISALVFKTLVTVNRRTNPSTLRATCCLLLPVGSFIVFLCLILPTAHALGETGAKKQVIFVT